jgi:hypothetical protein
MPEGVYITEAGRPLSTHPARERAIAELFGSQKTVATLTQLGEVGLAPRSVRHRAALGRLHRVYPTVYSTTPPELLPRKAQWLAAVLACGPGALLSHRTAAALLGVRDTRRARIDVTSPGGRGRRLSNIDAHRATTLTPADLTEREGIPCTSLARTIVDLAPLVSRRAVERAIDQSEALQIFDLRAVEDVLARNATLPGAAIVQSLLEEYQRTQAHFDTVTENDFEEAFFALCDAAGFPRPEVQQYFTLPGGDVVRADFVWRDLKIIVETDGGQFHRTRRAREADARRDLLFAQAGWQTLRLTKRMVLTAPAETTRALAGVLARARARQYSSLAHERT